MDKATETLNAKAPAPPAAAERRVTASAEKSKEKAGKPGLYFYVGPTLRGLIRNGDMFRGGKAAALESAKAAVAKHPEVKALLVSAEAFPSARLRVKEPGNALYASYQKIARKAKAGGEKEA